MPGKLTFVDLFAGIGGATRGLRDAGLEHLASFDNELHAARSLRCAGFVAAWADLREPLQLARTVPDIVWASPPCQPWSAAGKRDGEHDARNLWPATFDRIDELRPRWFMAENVAALSLTPYWNEVLAEVEERFAFVSYAVLDSARFGVPSHRDRVYLVAGPAPIRWPVGSSRFVPASDVVGPGFLRSEHGGATARPTSRPSPCVTTVGNLYLYLDDPGARPKTDGAVGPGGVRLSPRKCAGLVGLPLDVPLPSKKGAAYRLVGNACSPPVVEALARAVLEADANLV